MCCDPVPFPLGGVWPPSGEQPSRHCPSTAISGGPRRILSPFHSRGNRGTERLSTSSQPHPQSAGHVAALRAPRGCPVSERKSSLSAPTPACSPGLLPLSPSCCSSHVTLLFPPSALAVPSAGASPQRATCFSHSAPSNAAFSHVSSGGSFPTAPCTGRQICDVFRERCSFRHPPLPLPLPPERSLPSHTCIWLVSIPASMEGSQVPKTAASTQSALTKHLLS